MPQSSHNPASELRNTASHAHDAAAAAQGKAEHPSAHERSEEDHEQAREELKRSEHLEAEAARAAKAKLDTDDKVEAVHVVRPGLPL